MSDLPSRIKAKISIDERTGKVVTNLVSVPKYSIHTFQTEDGMMAGTEVYFEGRLWYPVVYGQKGEKGWLIPRAKFLIPEEITYWNIHLQKEDTELDIQTYFRTIDNANWTHYQTELHRVSFEALKIAFGGY